jgi:hypothetical protein
MRNMPDRNTQIRTALVAGPVSSASLRITLGITRPTLATRYAIRTARQLSGPG